MATWMTERERVRISTCDICGQAGERNLSKMTGQPTDLLGVRIEHRCIDICRTCATKPLCVVVDTLFPQPNGWANSL